MDISLRSKGRGRAKDIFSSYGDLAVRMLPAASHIKFFGMAGDVEWTRGENRSPSEPESTLVRAILAECLKTPQVARLDATQIAIAIPIVLDSRPINILVVTVLCRHPHLDRQMMTETAGDAAPLVECLRRELDQQSRKAAPSATLSERTEELEWLFRLTENLHSNSSDPRAIDQLLGATVERMRACFGAVVVPNHGMELTYRSSVRVDMHAVDIFESCRPYFLNFVLRRKHPLIANKATAGSHMPPFKVLVLPIEPQKGRVIGYIALLKNAVLPGFGRRQLFLGRQIGHQVGALLESQYDLATGLLTRSAFAQDVERILNAAPPAAKQSLLYFDLDRLRVINERLGQACGDEAIVRIAELFRPPALPQDAITSRIGGDSFVIYLPGFDSDHAAECARRLVQSGSECAVGSHEEKFPLSLSCGVVRVRTEGAGLDGFIATAQALCARAKYHGGNRVQIDSDASVNRMRRKHDVVEVSKLRSALAEGRFCIQAQKTVSATDLSRIRSIECQVHMIGEAGELIRPEAFMPCAQRHQMLRAIDHWVIHNVLREIQPYADLLLEANVNVAIDISGQSLQDEIFVEAAERWLIGSPTPPASVVFGITQTAALANMVRVTQLMDRLLAQGCSFSLNEFGTGVDFSCLERLRMSRVKIDALFTRDLLSNERSDLIVQNVVRTARALGIESVAECVESLEVADRLCQLGVDYIQGLIVHRPEPLVTQLEASLVSTSTKV